MSGMERALEQHAIGLIARLLRERTGQVISEDRRWRIERAIEGVLRKRGIGRSADIISLLTHPDSAQVEQELVEALLNNETYFFRDRQVFTELASAIIPAICHAKDGNRQLRIWSVGCSTGQEPLSLAMLAQELGLRNRGWDVSILATDISHSAIATARQGLYNRFEIQRGLAAGQMLRHFTETEQGWQASSELLSMVRYQVGNLLDPPPPGPFDLILCRNLMLYFDDFARRRACERLHEVLSPHGRLLLGGGEAMLEARSGFLPASRDFALYRRVDHALAA
jgi:chemotaxis protein methyltransferase CheR